MVCVAGFFFNLIKPFSANKHLPFETTKGPKTGPFGWDQSTDYELPDWR